MTFWGVYLKPNEPYTLRCNDDDVAVSNRLRITQATLGDATRCSPARSIVRCSVGDKPAIAICSLSVKELTCCQLELEFEEYNDVVFSVMGPRGVYLAGYLVASVSAARQHSVHKRQEKTTMEVADCSDHDLHKDGVDSSKTGLDRESTDAQNTGIGHSGKHIKGGNRLLKCSGVKNIITLDQKTRKDGNKGSNNEDQEKLIAVKTHSVFGRLLEKKRCATEKKKRNRRRKRNQSTSEATAKEHADATQYPGGHENLKVRKRKSNSKDCSGKNASSSL
ncbi:hypothetical protein QVD17_10317 [Tagetes erecta]|uniref:peptidylprolyl isomerase n=1 Tax=Tagetes erecta TaxID=13708 RepID=A0AAD8L7P3_TARER|nr:hypothetical protein QVD17_10317 [Tagetes erecta]